MKTKAPASDHKVIWAVDAFPDSLETQVQAGGGARFFLDRYAGEVEPVFVYKPDPPGLFVQETPDLDRPWLDTGRKNVSMMTKLSGLANVTKPKFISCNSYSNRGMVQSLIRYAEAARANLIVVGSHSRKGVTRALLGSFAEELVLTSHIPVLVTSKKATVGSSSRFETILFPTDFSPASRLVFDTVVRLAKSLKVNLVILHKVELTQMPLPYPILLPPAAVASYKELIEQDSQQGDDWCRVAKAAGVNASFRLVRNVDDAAGVIAKAAKRYPSCVVIMASGTGPWETRIVGSTTRKVVRQATCPVLVLPPPLAGEKAKQQIR